MIIISKNNDKFKYSNYYNKNECWDYPFEELGYLLEKESSELKRKVYIIYKDRIYETLCEY